MKTDKQFTAALQLIHVHADILQLTKGSFFWSRITSPAKLVKEYRKLIKQTQAQICSQAFMDSLDKYVELHEGWQKDRRKRCNINSISR